MDLGDLGVVSHRLADPTSSMTGLPQPPPTIRRTPENPTTAPALRHAQPNRPGHHIVGDQRRHFSPTETASLEQARTTITCANDRRTSPIASPQGRRVLTATEPTQVGGRTDSLTAVGGGDACIAAATAKSRPSLRQQSPARIGYRRPIKGTPLQLDGSPHETAESLTGCIARHKESTS